MSKITTAHVNMSHRLWVDDLSQVARGSRISMRKQVIRCLIDTCQIMEAAGLKISPKSVVICSHIEDARIITRRAAAQGCKLKYASQAPYLGADLSGGRRQARATRRSRATKHHA
eukprot:602721-Pyramimonas_sp.AAC.1